jgi:hypothetical protein
VSVFSVSDVGLNAPSSTEYAWLFVNARYAEVEPEELVILYHRVSAGNVARKQASRNRKEPECRGTAIMSQINGSSSRQRDLQKHGARRQPAISRTGELTRIMHEPPAATADMSVLPGVLGSRTLRRTDKYASGPVPRRRGMVARWHDHLHDLATASRT